MLSFIFSNNNPGFSGCCSESLEFSWFDGNERLSCGVVVVHNSQSRTIVAEVINSEASRLCIFRKCCGLGLVGYWVVRPHTMYDLWINSDRKASHTLVRFCTTKKHRAITFFYGVHARAVAVPHIYDEHHEPFDSNQHTHLEDDFSKKHQVKTSISTCTFISLSKLQSKYCPLEKNSQLWFVNTRNLQLLYFREHINGTSQLACSGHFIFVYF